MTTKEAIKWYEDKLRVNKTVGLLGPQNDAAELALAALKEQETRMSNPPITKAELWGMDDTPVYVVPMGKYADSGLEPEWCIISINGKYSCANPAATETYEYEFKDYGTGWLAYRYKLEVQ